MKKIAILSVFLLIFSFFTIIFEKPVYAETTSYEINIDCLVNGTSSDLYTYTKSSNTLNVNYSDIADDGYITFTASISQNPTHITYQWKNTSKDIVSPNNRLVIYKSLTENNQLVRIGNTRYVLCVTDTLSNTTEEIVVYVNIGGSAEDIVMLTQNSNIPNEVYLYDNNIDFYATLPVTSAYTIGWYVKSPQDTEYQIASSNNNYKFIPADMVSAKIGYGTYKIVAVAKIPDNSQTKKFRYYYSDVYEINCTTSPYVYEGAGTVHILSKKIDNSMAEIEAFEYSLSNTKNMDYSKIHWYINNVKMASGATFVYEPTSTDLYKVSVKYEGANGDSYIANLEQSPKPTNTYILILSIVGVVIVLSSILAISIIISNKKRDVVW